MKFIIHYKIESNWDVYEDSIIISGEDIDEIREKAKYETEKRHAFDCRSEQIE